MIEAPQIPEQDAINIRRVACAIRFALVAIVLGLSYLSLRSSLSIGGFQQIFADMLGGRPLPALTQFVLSALPVFVGVSVVVPLVAFATLFMRGVIASFYIISALGFVTIVQFILLYHGLSAPLTQIISAMGATP